MSRQYPIAIKNHAEASALLFIWRQGYVYGSNKDTMPRWGYNGLSYDVYTLTEADTNLLALDNGKDRDAGLQELEDRGLIQCTKEGASRLWWLTQIGAQVLGDYERAYVEGPDAKVAKTQGFNMHLESEAEAVLGVLLQEYFIYLRDAMVLGGPSVKQWQTYKTNQVVDANTLELLRRRHIIFKMETGGKADAFMYPDGFSHMVKGMRKLREDLTFPATKEGYEDAKGSLIPFHGDSPLLNKAVTRWETPARSWPDPTPEMLDRWDFNAVWGAIKNWDINVPDAYEGYTTAEGNHVRAILDAIDNAKPQGADKPRGRGNTPAQIVARWRRDLESLLSCNLTEQQGQDFIDVLMVGAELVKTRIRYPLQGQKMMLPNCRSAVTFDEREAEFESTDYSEDSLAEIHARDSKERAELLLCIYHHGYIYPEGRTSRADGLKVWKGGHPDAGKDPDNPTLPNVNLRLEHRKLLQTFRHLDKLVSLELVEIRKMEDHFGKWYRYALSDNGLRYINKHYPENSALQTDAATEKALREHVAQSSHVKQDGEAQYMTALSAITHKGPLNYDLKRWDRLMASPRTESNAIIGPYYLVESQGTWHEQSAVNADSVVDTLLDRALIELDASGDYVATPKGRETVYQWLGAQAQHEESILDLATPDLTTPAPTEEDALKEEESFKSKFPSSEKEEPLTLTRALQIVRYTGPIKWNVAGAIWEPVAEPKNGIPTDFGLINGEPQTMIPFEGVDWVDLLCAIGFMWPVPGQGFGGSYTINPSKVESHLARLRATVDFYLPTELMALHAIYRDGPVYYESGAKVWRLTGVFQEPEDDDLINQSTAVEVQGSEQSMSYVSYFALLGYVTKGAFEEGQLHCLTPDGELYLAEELEKWGRGFTATKGAPVVPIGEEAAPAKTEEISTPTAQMVEDHRIHLKNVLGMVSNLGPVVWMNSKEEWDFAEEAGSGFEVDTINARPLIGYQHTHQSTYIAFAINHGLLELLPDTVGTYGISAKGKDWLNVNGGMEQPQNEALTPERAELTPEEVDGINFNAALDLINELGAVYFHPEMREWRFVDGPSATYHLEQINKPSQQWQEPVNEAGSPTYVDRFIYEGLLDKQETTLRGRATYALSLKGREWLKQHSQA